METPGYLEEVLETIIQTERKNSEIRGKAAKMLQDLEIGDKIC